MSTAFNLRGKLTLTIHACRNLKNRELLGKMDPFCEVRLSNNKEKFKTRVAKDGHVNPVFEQSYIFNLEGKEQLLHMVVWNEGTLSDDHLGRCDIDLSMLDLSGQKRWYQLKDRSDFTKITGEFGMTAVWEGVGLPESSEAYKSHQARISGAAPTSPASAASPAATSPAVSPAAPVQQQSPPQPQQYASAQPNYNQPPPQQQQQQQYAPPQQQYGSQQPQYGSQQPQYVSQQPQYGSQQPPQYGSQQPQYGSQQPQYAPPPQQQYAAPPQVYSQAPPVYSAPPMPVAQPVYQQAPQPTIVYQPPQQVYVQQPPTITYQQPQQQVVYQQMPPRGQIIGYWPNGQPRYAGQ